MDGLLAVCYFTHMNTVGQSAFLSGGLSNTLHVLQHHLVNIFVSFILG